MTIAQGVFCFAVGLIVGAVYFGGLWQTVKMLKTARHTARLLLVSWFLRSAFFVAVFYVMMQGNWQRLAAGFAGMITVRLVMSFYMKRLNALENGGRA